MWYYSNNEKIKEYYHKSKGKNKEYYKENKEQKRKYGINCYKNFSKEKKENKR